MMRGRGRLGCRMIALLALAVAPVTAAAQGGAGYVLMYDGKVVSGPRAATFTAQQAYENCAAAWKLQPTLAVTCTFNGKAISADDSGVRNAIIADIANPSSSITANIIIIKNVRFEGAFATADVTDATRKTFDPPIMFLKKTGAAWKVIFTGTGMEPGQCKDLGFPRNSKMCGS